jgi:hypothetical protein
MIWYSSSPTGNVRKALVSMAKYPDAAVQTVIITSNEARDFGDVTVAVDRDSHVVHISLKKTQSQCASGWIHRCYRRRRRNEQVLQ